MDPIGRAVRQLAIMGPAVRRNRRHTAPICGELGRPRAERTDKISGRKRLLGPSDENVSNFNGRGRIGQMHCLSTYRQRFLTSKELLYRSIRLKSEPVSNASTGPDNNRTSTMKIMTAPRRLEHRG